MQLARDEKKPLKILSASSFTMVWFNEELRFYPCFCDITGKQLEIWPNTNPPFTKIEIKTTVTGIDGFAVKH